MEAKHLNSSTIEPTHLLLGLCKAVDVDPRGLFNEHLQGRELILEELVREVRRLRVVFETVGFDARAFRRALRRELGKHTRSPTKSHHLRRSNEAKQVFVDAEQVAEMADCVVFPVHLFHAVLSATKDAYTDLMARAGCDPERLKKVTKREAMLGWIGNSAQRRLN